MTDTKATLDSLRIDRGRKAPSRGAGPWIVALVLVLLLAGAGAAAYVWWPRPGLAVHAATAEARGDIAAGGGLDATGYVVARRLATLAPKFLGKLVELNVEEGQRVKAGEVVARLDDTTFTAALRQAQAQQSQARTAFDDAAPIFARYQRLHDQGAISTDAYENQRALYDAAREAVGVAEANVKMAQTNLADTVIYAPYAGVITNKAAQVGEIVAPGGSSGSKTGIATIVDMDTLEVEVDVSENYIDRVHAGGAATVVLDAYSDWEIPASVIAVIPTADRSKGTVKVRVGFKVKDARILPDMGARVTFATDANAPHAAPKGVLVPREAVKDNGRTGTVFIIDNDDRLEKREVPLGTRTQQSVTVTSGVAPGERLVTGDQAPLRDGMKVSIADAV
jgi:RND family efflux transporter MFP subunit